MRHLSKMAGMTATALVVVAVGLTVFAVQSCETKRPGTERPENERARFNHGLVNAAVCSGCHLEDRPANFLGQVHGGGQDCKVCHALKNDSSGWLPRLAFSHDPKPTSCLECHIKDRPPRPHPPEGTCVSCHQYPSWK